MDDTVGAHFDDRTDFPERLSSSEVLPTSVVQIYRYPPDPREVTNIRRYGSLMPESTAIPRKRALEVSTPGNASSSRVTASIEDRVGAQPNGMYAVPNKRQRIHDWRLDRECSAGQQLHSQADEAERLQPTSQHSVHQVYDSQGSPARKREHVLRRIEESPLLIPSQNIIRMTPQLLFRSPAPKSNVRAITITSPRFQTHQLAGGHLVMEPSKRL